MSAHPIMSAAVMAFAPKTVIGPNLHKMLEKRNLAWNSLLRLPFKVEVETRAAGRNGQAEYSEMVAHEDEVLEAVDALIDRYMVELEEDVKRRMELRNALDSQP
jgi:hypothetical protein